MTTVIKKIKCNRLILLLLMLASRVLSLQAQSVHSLSPDSSQIDFGYGLQSYSRSECQGFAELLFSYNVLSHKLLPVTSVRLQSIDLAKASDSHNFKSSGLKCILYNEYVDEKNESYFILNSTKYYMSALFGKKNTINKFHISSCYKIELNSEIYLALSVTVLSGNDANNIIKPVLFELIDNNRFNKIEVLYASLFSKPVVSRG